MDRNYGNTLVTQLKNRSLSARRAWIEILRVTRICRSAGSLSARRAWIEMSVSMRSFLLVLSLSARRAWIEMEVYKRHYLAGLVALRKESVDRNINIVTDTPAFERRSPQGERG